MIQTPRVGSVNLSSSHMLKGVSALSVLASAVALLGACCFSCPTCLMGTMLPYCFSVTLPTPLSAWLYLSALCVWLSSAAPPVSLLGRTRTPADSDTARLGTSWGSRSLGIDPSNMPLMIPTPYSSISMGPAGKLAMQLYELIYWTGRIWFYVAVKAFAPSLFPPDQLHQSNHGKDDTPLILTAFKPPTWWASSRFAV